MKKALALVAIAGLAGMASAQSATVNTTANGGASATVAPGATISIASVITWTGAPQFAGIQGGITVQGDAGSGSNFTSAFNPGALVNLGAFSGGSRTGMDIAVTPAFFTGGVIVAPSGNNTGLNVAAYDLVINDPGVYTVNWVAPGSAPSVRLFPSTSSPAFVEAPTSYNGATITVTPAPASLALVGLGGLMAGRRRR